MKSLSARSAGTARRIVVVATAGAAAVSLLGGCGFAERQQSAAIVNGQSIPESEVSEVHDQLAAAKYDFPESEILTGLIATPLLQKALEPSGGYKPDQAYATVVNSIPNASEATKRFVATVALVSSQTMTPAQVQAYRDQLSSAQISVNPRFGSLEKAADSSVLFRLGQSNPAWIKAGTNDSPTAPEQSPVPTTPAG